jgi:hypothetical protein
MTQQLEAFMLRAKSIRVWGSLALTLVLCLAARWSAATEPEQPAGSTDKDDSADSAQRDEILQGEEWRETMRAWEAWLAVQRLYDEDQVEELKRQMAAKIERMSAPELEEFLDDFEAKLQILMSAEARDARRWLTETLSVASKKYAKKVRAELPDVANLSAAELKVELDAFESRRVQVRRSEAASQQARQDRTRAVQADLRRQQRDSEKARDRAAQNQSSGTANYFVPNRAQKRSFSERPNAVPFWGFGFW